MSKKCFIILTNKKWHSELLISLKKYYRGDIIYHISWKKDFTYSNIRRLNPEYIFVLHWSYKITKQIFDNYKTIIFHMTDLPYGRGGSPLQNLIIKNKIKTKISAIECTEILDGGKIYLKSSISLKGSAQEIFERSSKILLTMIKKIVNKNYKLTKQNGKVVTFKRRTPKQSNIKNLTTLNDIYNYIRMLDADSYPAAFLETKNIQFLFSKAKKSKNKLKATVQIIRKKNE